MRKKGFTLAETLIVITIIGVLAAIMIPSLKGGVIDKRKVMFKKAYRLTDLIVKDLINNQEMYPYDPKRPGFKNTDFVRLAGEDTTYGGTSENAKKNKFAKLFERKIDTVETEYEKYGFKWFTASDGISYAVERTDFDTNTEATVFVNTDGINKGYDCVNDSINTNIPKCANAEKQQDIFRLFVNYDGTVKPADNVAREMLTSYEASKQ